MVEGGTVIQKGKKPVDSIDWEKLDASKLMCSIEFGEGCEACQ